VAVKEPGQETFRLCRELVDDMILVDNDDTCAAIKDMSSSAFRRFLDQLTDRHFDESGNPAYRLFLGAPGAQ
jgi:hypothetical protein